MMRTEHSRRAGAPPGQVTAVDPEGETAADPLELRRGLEEARLELEQARKTLRAIRAGGFDALVIDTGSRDELFTLSSAEQSHRLVEVMAEGAPRYFRAVAVDYDGTLAEGEVVPDTLGALAEARAGDPGDRGDRADHERVACRVPKARGPCRRRRGREW